MRSTGRGDGVSCAKSRGVPSRARLVDASSDQLTPGNTMHNLTSNTTRDSKGGTHLTSFGLHLSARSSERGAAYEDPVDVARSKREFRGMGARTGTTALQALRAQPQAPQTKVAQVVRQGQWHCGRRSEPSGTSCLFSATSQRRHVRRNFRGFGSLLLCQLVPLGIGDRKRIRRPRIPPFCFSFSKRCPICACRSAVFPVGAGR
eukprot:7322458-Prymnesium_polylepis.1